MADNNKDKEYIIQKRIQLLRELAEAYTDVNKSVSDDTANIKRQLEALGVNKPFSGKAAVLEEIKVQKYKLGIAKELIKLKEEEIEKEKQLKEEKKKTAEDEQRRQKELKEVENKKRQEYKKDLARFNDFRKNSTNSIKFSSIGSTVYGNSIAKAEEIREKTAEEVFKDYSRRGIADRDHYGKMLREIDSKTNESIRASGLGNSAQALENAARFLNDVGKLFETVLSSLGSLIKSGIQRQTQIYEQTYGNVSTRLNLNQTQYSLKQLGYSGNLLYDGLGDNVDIAELMQMWDKLASRGMGTEDVFTYALDNVITNKIVPYLDTTSTGINIINDKVNGSFIKDIRGINQANLEIVGNNYATEKLLNQMIDLVQPLSDEAVKNLALGSTEVTTLVNSLIQDYGWSEDAAIEAATNAFKMQEYSAQMLRSGSTYEKLNVITAMEHPELNLNNPKDLNNFMGLNARNASRLLTGLNFDTTANSLDANIVREAYGIPYAIAQAITQNAGVDWVNVAKNFDLSQEDIDNYTNKVTTNFKNGMYQTASQKQSNLMSNLSTSVAVIEERVGTIGTDILKSLGSILHAIIGTGAANTLSSMLGLGGGKTLGSLISTTGGVALGAISTVAGTALAASIAKGITDKENKSAIDSAYNQLSGTTLEGNNTAALGKSIYNKKSINKYWDAIGFVKNNLSNFAGNVANTFSSDIAGSNNRRYYNLMNAIQQEGISAKEKEDYLLAFMLLLAGENRLSDIGGSESELKSYVENEDGPSVVNALNLIGKSPLWVYQPHSTEGKIKNLNSNWENNVLNTWNYHRQGLAEVPYDNYAAMLHAGETVLTASTTAAINDMVMEYRNSQNQNYSLDAAIQNQTAQLIQKMDDIIHNMNLMSITQRPINTASEKLKNNMLSLTSSLAFQN